MPTRTGQQSVPSVENIFNQGLKTEFTGLNFPEHAATASANCVFNRIGNVNRRPGINYETSYTTSTINRTSTAVNYYRWKNVGGDGSTQVLVLQVGATLYFYQSSSATTAAPLSTTLIASTVTVSSYTASGGSFDATQECTFTDGNGYLFVFHPTCDPFFVTWTPGSPATVAATAINIQIRDFNGIPETSSPGISIPDNVRPSALSAEHQYNLINQGWSVGSAWNANISGCWSIATGAQTFTVSSSTGTAPVNGNSVTIYGSLGILYQGSYRSYAATLTGTVTGVSLVAGAGTITVNVTGLTEYNPTGMPSQAGQTICGSGNLVEASVAFNNTVGYVSSWFTAIGNYPSNSDVWWEFRNSSNVFSPGTTINNITLDNAPAPKGHVVLNAFNQQRSGSSGVVGITDITTTVRPRTGCWYQGRIWYAGVDAAANASGDAPYYTWTENIYFSQVAFKTDQFARCYQTDDPTSDSLFDILASDGGVIVIQGSGAIYKLFPVQNGVLVFAANGIWFITGGQSIGFAANDYTITKISAVQSFAATSYIDVLGWPMFWNEEGIYYVQPGGENGPYRFTGFNVQNIVFQSIKTFYQAIPLSSRKKARGDFDPLNYIVRWLYKSTETTGTTDTYQFDSVLCMNTSTGAFYTYTLPNPNTSGYPTVNGVAYIQNPGGSGTPSPVIKYITSIPNGSGSYTFTFSEEKDTTNYTDFVSSGLTSTGQTGSTLNGINFISSFETGYQIKGAAQTKTQIGWLYLYLNNSSNCGYKHQGIWNYAISRESGQFSPLEQVLITTSSAWFGQTSRRHKIRGRGRIYQFNITSVDSTPFDFTGWSVASMVNAGN